MFSSNTSQVSNDANYIEDVFSTYLYTGTGSAQTITNDIDLSGEGGLVWIKGRNNSWNNILQDTNRGINSSLCTNNTDGAIDPAGVYLTSFNSNGFSIGTNGSVNFNTNTYTSWSFREQAKFFDVVTYTGNGTSQTINHNLGSTPGCIITKRLNAGSNWLVYHRSISTQRIYLNNTDAATGTIGVTSVGSTSYDVNGSSELNENGGTYVAYIYAHNAGGFGLTGTDNVISCGSYTGTGSPLSVTLGYEPQWILVKRATGGTTNNWVLMDTMRGMSLTNAMWLYPNVSDAESDAGTQCNPTATGFTITSSGTNLNAGGSTYIYIAIRRGPMKVPTDATKVFAPVYAASPSTPYTVTTNFPVDLLLSTGTSGYDKNVNDRLRGGTTTSFNTLFTNTTGAESISSGSTGLGFQSNTAIIDNGYWSGYGLNLIYWNFRRAPSFFDEVCYTGTGSARTVTHNLGVAPELIIVKGRNTSYGWPVYVAPVGNTSAMQLQSVSTPVVSDYWNNTTPTASVFSLGTAVNANESTKTYVAYLFATCAGVSKVGSYTGTGTTKQIDCGFTAGSRFVMIKRTDDDAGWYVWDSARGIVSGNDPYLLLNSTAAEVTNTDYVDTYSAGFELSSTAPAAINASGGTFIFLAIA